jgi:hypothetical protein
MNPTALRNTAAVISATTSDSDKFMPEFLQSGAVFGSPIAAWVCVLIR